MLVFLSYTLYYWRILAAEPRKSHELLKQQRKLTRHRSLSEPKARRLLVSGWEGIGPWSWMWPSRRPLPRTPVSPSLGLCVRLSSAAEGPSLYPTQASSKWRPQQLHVSLSSSTQRSLSGWGVKPHFQIRVTLDLILVHFGLKESFLTPGMKCTPWSSGSSSPHRAL